MILKVGCKGQAVVGLKERLASQGFWPEHRMGLEFTPKLEEAVAYFQQTHLDSWGNPLDVDGIVGHNTEWALKNPTGEAQASGLGPDTMHLAAHWDGIPAGLGENRRQILIAALSEHGVKEKPNGSNRGPGIDKYLPKWWLKKTGRGPAWCCFFVSWVTKRVFGTYPLGRNHGSCKAAWNAAKECGMDCDPEGIAILPGNAFYMRWGPRTGHIGFIYRVSEDRTEINTIEGNCGNRVKIGRRKVDERIHGIIDFYVHETTGSVLQFERGLIEARDVGKDGTR